MSECARCGECCKWMVIAPMKGLSIASRLYLKARVTKIENGYALLYAPCSHLKYEWQGKECPAEMMGVEEGVLAKCDIHENRPGICRLYHGTEFSNGLRFYVPPCCAMAGPHLNDKGELVR